MQIIKSEISEQHLQIDGRISVVEKHYYDDGSVYLHPYFADASWDLQKVAEDRATNKNTELARIAAQNAEAKNYEIPLTKTEFRDRFTGVEQVAIDNFNANYQSNPALTAEQKEYILSALEHWKDTTKVYLSLQKTIDIVTMYEALGLIGTGRAVEVLTI